MGSCVNLDVVCKPTRVRWRTTRNKTKLKESSNLKKVVVMEKYCNLNSADKEGQTISQKRARYAKPHQNVEVTIIFDIKVI